MNLDRKDRLIIMMLCEIGKATDAREFKWDLISDAVMSGDDWVLEDEYGNYFPEETRSPDDVKETVDILEMWDFIEGSLEHLDPPERKEIEDAHHGQPAFHGFDGNYDDHYHIAHTLVEQMGRFSRFRKRGLNSHTRSSLPRYRKMLAKFLEMRPNLTSGMMTAGQIREVLAL